MLSTVLGTGNIAVNKTDQNSCSHLAYLLVGETLVIYTDKIQNLGNT